ncbi:hypothetical protein KKG31_00635 [Patescibacteria group bacterium]|nr:hypothetical protein [Patescibacteria group bacterium]MBU1757691.1 hypothetical protein [Patescibacteria group bacterium]
MAEELKKEGNEAIRAMIGDNIREFYEENRYTPRSKLTETEKLIRQLGKEIGVITKVESLEKYNRFL